MGEFMDYIMKNEKLFIFLGVMFVLIIELSMLTIAFMPKVFAKNSDESNQVERIIYRENISVKNLLNDYQTKFQGANLHLIDLEYLTVLEDTYYIGLFQDVILFITPLEMSGDINNDIVLQTGIIMDKESNNQELGLHYYKEMIEVNNQFIYNINELLDAIDVYEIVDQNNGLLLAKVTNNYESSYVIERKYAN